MKLLRWALAPALALACLVPAAAQAPLQANMEEQAALLSLEQQKLVRLHEQAKTLLERAPDAPSSNYFMGYALHHADGDLPRARFYLKRAISLYEAKYGSHPSPTLPWGWLDRSLLELEQVSGEMDEYQEQIDILDRYGELMHDLYPGGQFLQLQALYAWPLMKLNKRKEALERLGRASMAIDENTRTTYLNTLGAVEMESDRPSESYKAFTTLIEEVQRRHWSLNCTYLRNGGEAAAAMGHFEEAEQLYLEATKHFDPTSFSNPWWDLATLYLGQGRFPEALSALTKAQRWIHDSQPFLAQQSLAATEQLTAELELQCGLIGPALHMAKEFVDRPDRKGGDSVKPDQWESANLLVYREVLLAQRAADAEEMSWAKGWRWWELLFQKASLAWQAHLAGQRAAAILIEHERLYTSLRYAYAPGTVVIPNYVRLDLVGIYGPGTVTAAIDDMLSSRFESLERERPYLESLHAEALAESGHSEEADKLIDTCLQKLPPTEVLLRARLMARQAQLKEDEGDSAGAFAAYQKVVEKAPAMLRLLNLRIPVEITGDSGPVLGPAASMALGSPRFRHASGGFTIAFSEGGKGYRAQLVTPNGTVLARAEVAQGKTADETARSLVAELHAAFFAPAVDMSQLDVTSLDGAITGRVRSEELQKMFGIGGDTDANATNTTTGSRWWPFHSTP